MLSRAGCRLQADSAPASVQHIRTSPSSGSTSDVELLAGPAGVGARARMRRIGLGGGICEGARCRRCGRPGRGRAGVHTRADPSDLACAPQDIRTLQQLDIPVYIDPTRTPNWAASLPTDFTTYVNSETESQSCVGGSVSCNAAPAIYSPADAWTGPNDATFPHA